LAGAILYGGVRVTLDPSWLYAYSYGGVLFHSFRDARRADPAAGARDDGAGLGAAVGAGPRG